MALLRNQALALTLTLALGLALALALALSLSLSLSLSLTLSPNPSPDPSLNLLRNQALSLVADSALTPLRLASYDVLWMLDMQPGLQPYVMEAATLCAQPATACDARCSGCSTWTLRRTVCQTGLDPGRADARQVCYSHVRSSPWTEYSMSFSRLWDDDGVASSFGAAGDPNPNPHPNPNPNPNLNPNPPRPHRSP